MRDLGGIALDELTLDNIGSWPKVVKGVLIAILCAGILGMGWFFDIQKGLQRLQQAKTQEAQLRAEFEVKQSHVVNLELYKAQMKTATNTLNALLHQLPSKTEIPGLLEDISKLGLASGLEFKLIRPMAETQKAFFTELPIHMTVMGDYHQLAEFISHLSELARIVVVGDFSIEPDKKTSKIAPASKVPLNPQGQLTMDVIAKTYHYNELSTVSGELGETTPSQREVQ